MIRDREKLREALALRIFHSDYWPTTVCGSGEAALNAARLLADWLIELFDQHTAPQAEPAAEAKEWRLRAASTIEQLASECEGHKHGRNITHDDLNRMLDEAVAHWGDGVTRGVWTNDEMERCLARAEAAESELARVRESCGIAVRNRDQLRAELDAMTKDRDSMTRARDSLLRERDGWNRTNLDRALSELRESESTIKTLARLLAEAEKR